MSPHLPVLPPQASEQAAQVDRLFWYLVGTCGFIALVVAALVITFSIRYRRRDPDEIPEQPRQGYAVELSFSAALLVLAMSMFFWGANVYIDLSTPPADAMEVFAVGKQWMWKVQHSGGQREINELHVPVGRPVKVTLASQDVIHSFFIPAFRVKQDAVPGYYTSLWFTATKPGRYHLFCAEYCGTNHARMIGWVYAMQPKDYAQWLVSGAPEASLASYGEKMFHQYGCANCHQFDAQARCPNLQNLYGNIVRLKGGQTVVADEAYLRESILQPAVKVVEGYEPVMPAFQGVIDEEHLLQLIEYIKALQGEVVP